MKTKYLKVKDGERLNIDCFPNIHKSGSIKGMKALYWRHNPLLVRCGSYIYNVQDCPEIYNQAY